MKKIMFNEQYGLQQATFDGLKTMTRRIVPDKVMEHVPAYQEQYYAGALEPISVEDAIMQMCGSEHMFHVGYEVGEIVAIAQRYSQLEKEIERLGLPLNLQEWVYKHKGYLNKMYVRAEDMPRHIKITCKKVERLQAISDEDCLKEGIFSSDVYAMSYGIPYMNGGVFFYYSSPREAFAALIDKVSGKGTWESNPLVFAYEFKLID